MEDGEPSKPPLGRHGRRRAKAREEKKRKEEEEKRKEEEHRERMKSGHFTLVRAPTFTYTYLSPEDRRCCFFSFLDLENMKKDLQATPPPPTKDQNLRAKMTAVLQRRYGDPTFKIKKAIGVGNKAWVCSIGKEEEEVVIDLQSLGIEFIDVFPRDRFCAGVNPDGSPCGIQLQHAVPRFRPSKPFETNTDVADHQLVVEMFRKFYTYGPPLKFVLCSADGDFIRPLNYLKACNVEIYLVTPRVFNQELPGAATSPFHVFPLQEVLDMQCQTVISSDQG